MDVNVRIANLMIDNNLPYDETLALDLYVSFFVEPDPNFSFLKIKGLVEQNLEYNVQDAILTIMKAVETLKPTIHPAIKDMIINIDLQDLETVIEALD